MSSSDIWVLILLMAIASYIPRMLPLLFMDKLKLPKKVEKFLKLIPYTAMTALVFPACIQIDGQYPWIGLIGVSVAGILSWFKCPTILCVIAGIVVDLIIYLCLGVGF